eukprot:UN11211
MPLIMQFQKYHSILGSTDGVYYFGDETKLSNIKQITVQININEDITQQIIHTFSQPQLSLFTDPYRWMLRQSNGQLACLFRPPSNGVDNFQHTEITLVPIGNEYPPLNRSTNYLYCVTYNTRYNDYHYCSDYGVYKPRNDGYWTELVLIKRDFDLDYIWISRPPDGYEFLLRMRQFCEEEEEQIQQVDESSEEEEEEPIDDDTTNNWKWILIFVIGLILIFCIGLWCLLFVLCGL